MFFRRKRRRVYRRRVKKQSSQEVAHYQEHKEFARKVITERLRFWNTHYQFTYNRVAIKKQRRCWGSCSEHGNLNFNYKIIFLPEHLMDYVIVHELCHIAELNHSRAFWGHVEQVLPDYKVYRKHLTKMTNVPKQGFPSSVVNKVETSTEVSAVINVFEKEKAGVR